MLVLSVCYKNGIAVVAHTQRSIVLCQHEAEHHLQSNQQRMEVPNDGRLVQQRNSVGGRKTSQGKDKWFPTVISHVLKNSFYCGIITYHKEYVPDYLKQKKVKKDGFDWYLRVGGDPDKPLHCKLEGKRRSTTKIVVTQDFSPALDSSTTGCNQGLRDYLLIVTFVVTYEDAKAYMYRFSTKRRVHKRNDIRINLYI